MREHTVLRQHTFTRTHTHTHTHTYRFSASISRPPPLERLLLRESLSLSPPLSPSSPQTFAGSAGSREASASPASSGCLLASSGSLTPDRRGGDGVSPRAAPPRTRNPHPQTQTRNCRKPEQLAPPASALNRRRMPAHAPICMHIYIYMCIYTCVCVCIYIYIYMHIYICIDVHTRVYVHTHVIRVMQEARARTAGGGWSTRAGAGGSSPRARAWRRGSAGGNAGKGCACWVRA